MSSDLGPAIVTGSVAAVAIVASSLTSWRSLANQRKLARDQRSWDAVQELYVDLIVRSDLFARAIVHTMSRGEPKDWPTKRDEHFRLNARVEAYASDKVRALHVARVTAYSEFAGALVHDLERHPDIDLGAIPPSESTWDARRVAYNAAEDALCNEIRAELLNLGPSTTAPLALEESCASGGIAAI
jgi:hypothetical protein